MFRCRFVHKLTIIRDGVDLYLEFYRQDAKSKKEIFLCSSKQSLIWVTRRPSESIVRPNLPSPSSLPIQYLQALLAAKL